jgi:hypothetical protein
MALASFAAWASACSRSSGLPPPPAKDAAPAASVAAVAPQTSARAPAPDQDAADALVRGETHWPTVGPSASLDGICKAPCVVAWRRTTTRGPILEVAVFAPSELGDPRDRSGMHYEFLALRTARGWFAEPRSDRPQPNRSYTPFDRVRDLDDGVLVAVRDQAIRSIDEHVPPRISYEPERERAVHCNTDAAGVPACTRRIPVREECAGGSTADGGCLHPRWVRVDAAEDKGRTGN